MQGDERDVLSGHARANTGYFAQHCLGLTKTTTPRAAWAVGESAAIHLGVGLPGELPRGGGSAPDQSFADWFHLGIGYGDTEQGTEGGACLGMSRLAELIDGGTSQKFRAVHVVSLCVVLRRRGKWG
jgi:hypothetical protein